MGMWMKVLLSSVWIGLWMLLFVASSYSAHAEESAADVDAEERIAELEEKVSILTEEMGRLESIFAVPEGHELESIHGLGPAASKIYLKDKGLSIGGYGEVLLRTFQNKNGENRDDVFDSLRSVLYVGFKFNENWVFNSELEFEHGGTSGGGSVSAEFVAIDYLWKEKVNFRAGLLLVPMGFVNEIHEPNFFYGAQRPEIERVILPSTWRENGVGIYGRIADRVQYRVYVINGFRACGNRACEGGSGFSSGGLRGGRQRGSRALANDFAIVARFDVDVAPGLVVGGSFYTGQSGQEESGPERAPLVEGDAPLAPLKLPNARTTIYELHAQYRGYGLSLRSLWTEAFIEDAGRLSTALDLGPTASVANHMRGWYIEGGYDILPLFLKDTRMTLEPFVRYSQYDTQRDVNSRFARDKSKDIELIVAGLHFKPIPEIVFKVDYRHFNLASGRRANEIQALVGYVF